MSKQTFLKDELLIRLKKNLQFVPKKSVLPAYETVLFKIQGGVATMTTIDGEKQVSTTCNVVKSDGDVSFCIHARLLTNTLSLFLEQEVLFTVKEKEVQLKCGKSKYKFHAEDPSVFPLMPNIVSEFEASFTGATFNAAIEVAKEYCNSESSVAAQQGITLRMSDNKINFFGFGGFSIAKISVSPRSINRWEDLLIPVSAVTAINKCVSDGDIVDVIHNKDKVEVRTDEVSIIALCHNTRSPDYDKFFNKTLPNSIEVNTFMFLTALQRIKGFTDEEAPLIKISIGTTETVITAVDNKYNRDGEEVIEVMAESAHTFGVNVEFMITAVSSFTNDNMRILYEGGNPLNQIMIEPVGVLDNNNKMFLISPMGV